MKDQAKIARIVTIITLAYLVCGCAAMTLFPIRPFWRDEWCVIYNLKFKSPEMLWGKLDFTQQFPRVYLQLIKLFTARLNYSYFSLRFPSFLTGTAAVFMSYHLMNRLFKEGYLKYLFVLIIAAHPVFIDYFVQIKHYEMEMLLSLVAIWQLLELLSFKENIRTVNARYILLCTSFMVVPFFSYTYPIAVTPVFIVLFLHSMALYKNREQVAGWRLYMFHKWLPLILCAVSVTIFYVMDVSQLMRDKNMYAFWGGHLVQRGNNGKFITSWKTIVEKIWLLFANAGAGYLFEIIFGILGIASFVHGIKHLIKHLSFDDNDKQVWVVLYSVLLLVTIIVLYFSGKLPIGDPKFSAFTIPSIAFLIVFFLTNLFQVYSLKKFVFVLTIILFVALAGNIFMAFINRFMIDQYKKELRIYSATEKAVNLAYKNKIPILVTKEVGYPDDIDIVSPFLSMLSADEILKTFPAYKVGDTIAIYAIKDLKDVNTFKQALPPQVTSFIVGDGLSYMVFNR